MLKTKEVESLLKELAQGPAIASMLPGFAWSRSRLAFRRERDDHSELVHLGSVRCSTYHEIFATVGLRFPLARWYRECGKPNENFFGFVVTRHPEHFRNFHFTEPDQLPGILFLALSRVVDEGFPFFDKYLDLASVESALRTQDTGELDIVASGDESRNLHLASFWAASGRLDEAIALLEALRTADPRPNRTLDKMLEFFRSRPEPPKKFKW